MRVVVCDGWRWSMVSDAGRIPLLSSEIRFRAPSRPSAWMLSLAGWEKGKGICAPPVIEFVPDSIRATADQFSIRGSIGLCEGTRPAAAFLAAGSCFLASLSRHTAPIGNLGMRTQATRQTDSITHLDLSTNSTFFHQDLELRTAN